MTTDIPLTWFTLVISAGRSWNVLLRYMESRFGDTIFGSLETCGVRPLSFLTNMTRILYQGVIAVAAIKTISH